MSLQELIEKVKGQHSRGLMTDFELAAQIVMLHFRECSGYIQCGDER